MRNCLSCSTKTFRSGVGASPQKKATVELEFHQNYVLLSWTTSNTLSSTMPLSVKSTPHGQNSGSNQIQKSNPLLLFKNLSDFCTGSMTGYIAKSSSRLQILPQRVKTVTSLKAVLLTRLITLALGGESNPSLSYILTFVHTFVPESTCEITLRVSTCP